MIRAAAGSAARRSSLIPTATRIVTRTAMCSWSARARRPCGGVGSGRQRRACGSLRRASELGGSLLGEAGARIDGLPAAEWLARSLAALARHPRVRLLPRTTAFGYFPHNCIGLNERLTDHLADPPAGRARERLWQLRAREVVLATGAIERPLVFPGNDRPGIMLAGAAQTYLQRYGVRAGSRAVVVTSNDSAYQAALELRAAGVEIAAIADLRERADGPCRRGTERRNRSRAIAQPCAARAADLRVSGIELQGPNPRLRPRADVRRIHAERAPLLPVTRQAQVG